MLKQVVVSLVLFSGTVAASFAEEPQRGGVINAVIQPEPPGLMLGSPAVDDEPIATILTGPLVRLSAKRPSPCSKGIGSTGIFEGSPSMRHLSVAAGTT